jgi:hypothetical protein
VGQAGDAPHGRLTVTRAPATIGTIEPSIVFGAG